MNEKLEALFVEINYTSLSEPVFLWSNEQQFPLLVIKLLFLKVPYFKNRNSDSYILLKSLLLSIFILPILVLIFYVFIHLLIHLHSTGNLNFTFASLSAVNDILNFITTYPRKIAILWVPVLSIIYWNLRTKFAGQWMYCADLYNKISYESIDTKNPREILYQRCTLALDLVQVDLYSHKSFSKTFNVALEKSIYYVYKNYPNYLDEINDAKKFLGYL